MMKRILPFLAVIMLILSACSTPTAEGSGIKIVATTTIVGDIVYQVGGDLIDLSILLPVGADPHSFDPSPQDVAGIADAEIVFANGAGLEAFLENLIESADAQDKVVHVSENVELIDSAHNNDEEEGEEHEDEHAHETGDPHTWTDPNNVILWVDAIVETLADVDPDNAETYHQNAEDYKNQLLELDSWIRTETGKIPEDQRKIVTDHTLFGYFIAEYGFEQIGAVIPGYSTLSEPSAQDMADLIDAIDSLNVKAVFVGNTVNSSLSEQIAADTGTQLIFLYTGSLSDSDGDAATYLEYMRYNVNAIVNALED